MPALVDKYRPTCWAEVIGQDKVIRQVDTLRKRGLAGRGYWITGPSGTGKTTIARLIASEVADDWNTDEKDGSEVTTDLISEWKRDFQRSHPFGRGMCIIINEAHGLRGQILLRLQTVFDKLPPWCTFIFTTTNVGQQKFDELDEAPASLSRCVKLALTSQGLAPAFAKRAAAIADAEGLNGRPEKDYLRLVQECKNNMRAVLQEIDCGAMVATA